MALIDDLKAVIAQGEKSRAVQVILANCMRMRDSVESRKSNIDRGIAGVVFANLPQSIKDEGQVVRAGINTFRTFMDAHPEFFVGTPPE